MPESAQMKLCFGPFHLPSEVDLLYREQEVIPLEPRAVQVLRYLALNHERVITKEELLENVWPDVFTTDAVLKKAISQARRALGDDAEEARFIRTFHARGYQFIAEVACVEANYAEADQSRAPDQSSAQPSSLTPAIAGRSLSSGVYPVSARLKFAPAPTGRVSRDAFAAWQMPDFDQLAGRETEFQTLGAEYRNTQNQQGKPVLITGDPGLGKTQIARYFIRWAQAQGAQCLYARFFDYRGSQKAPFEMFLLLLRAVTGADSDQELREISATRLGVKLPDELFAGLSRGLVQTSEARTGNLHSDQFRVVVPIARAFIQQSRHQPLVLVFDDLQWADEESRELIGYLMRTSSSERLLVMLLARANEAMDSQHPLSRWLMQQADYRSFMSLALRPLTDLGCQAAVAAIFGGTSRCPLIPAHDWQTLMQLTEGNPYFLTEMLRLLVTESAVNPPPTKDARWHWHGIRNLQLPQSLVMAAKHKLERLTAETRTVIESAAVIGDEFRVETLSLLCDCSEEKVEAALLEALRIGVLSERGLSPGEDCRFHHSLLRRVLYEELPMRHRKRLHTQAAKVLEKIHARHPDRVAEAISAHHEAAGNQYATLEWSLRAWQAASSRWQWRNAVTCIERAARVVEEMKKSGTSSLNAGDHLRVLIGMSESYCASGRIRESAKVIESAIPLAEAINNPSLLAAALMQQSQAQSGLSHYPAAITPAECALELYKQNDDAAGASLAMLQISSARIALGEYERAAPLIENVLGDTRPHSRIAAIARGLLGWAWTLQGRFAQGMPLLEEAIQYHVTAGDLWQEAHLLRRLHWAQLCQGQCEAAVATARRARTAFRDVGDLPGEAKMVLGTGQARITQGLYHEGRTLIEQSLEKLRSIEDVHCEAEALWMLGRVDYLMGNFAEAESRLHYALELIREVGDRDDEFRILTDLARLNLLDGEPAEALRLADAAILTASELNNQDGIGESLTVRAEALRQLNQCEQALTEAERAVELLRLSGSGEVWRAYLALARALLATGKKGSPLQAIDALTACLEIPDRQRAELAHDETRLTELMATRQPLARELYDLLNAQNRKTEAGRLAHLWKLA